LNEITKESLKKMNQSHSKSKPEPNKINRIVKWVLTGLPLGGVIWASFLPLQTWMHQALILVTLIWFFVFYLLDALFLGG